MLLKISLKTKEIVIGVVEGLIFLLSIDLIILFSSVLSVIQGQETQWNSFWSWQAKIIINLLY